MSMYCLCHTHSLLVEAFWCCDSTVLSLSFLNFMKRHLFKCSRMLFVWHSKTELQSTTIFLYSKTKQIKFGVLVFLIYFYVHSSFRSNVFTLRKSLYRLHLHPFPPTFLNLETLKIFHHTNLRLCEFVVVVFFHRCLSHPRP